MCFGTKLDSLDCYTQKYFFNFFFFTLLFEKNPIPFSPDFSLQYFEANSMNPEKLPR